MNIVEVLLRELKVKHSKSFIEENFLNAPDSDNMLGIQRILSRYGIETVGIHFQDKEGAGLTFPCVMHLQDQFVVGIDFNKNIIKLHDGKRIIIDDLSDFSNKWTGDVLFVTDIQKAKEPLYIKNKCADVFESFISYSPFVLVACLVSLFFMNSNIFNPKSINMIFDLLGFGICTLLFLKQLHANSIFADKICSVLEKKGCDSVLESNEAKFLSVISWTEIGLAYFSSRIFYGCLYENSLFILQFVGWLAMPYGLWSIWSQAFKIKHWCTLCCLIQTIIWCTGIYNIISVEFIYVKYADVVIFAVCSMLSFVFIHIMSDLHSICDKFNMVNKNFLAFKMRKEILNMALLRSQIIDIKTEDSSIIWGDKSATTTLTVLTNPHCDPCAKMHKRLMNVINNNHNINIQYIYCSFNKEYDSSSLFCIAVYQQMPYKEAVEILDKWYQYGKYQREKFIKDIGVDVNKSEVLDEYTKHKLWKERVGLENTPTIIYAGHKLPENYNVEDFIYLDSER